MYYMKALITGGAGLVGSEVSKLLSEKGFEIITVDNYMRGKIFGPAGDTKGVMEKLRHAYNITHYEIDIRDDKVKELMKGVDLIVHTAAQPSHPRSIEIPMEDFEINAMGTLKMLEATRRTAPDAVFIYTSTNKVYGDAPNYFSYQIKDKRYEPNDPKLHDGFNEGLRIDGVLHTPFGVSKASADLYVQEYARLFGLRAGVFRMGCITGGAAMAVEQHNWEPFFMKKALSDEPLTIYGYGGYQVRDVIHARDLAALFFEFFRSPRPGEVYNIGGSRANSISLLEAIDLIEEITGKRIRYSHGPAREGDHIWYISDISKARAHFPAWNVRLSLKEIFTELRDVLAAHSTR